MTNGVQNIGQRSDGSFLWCKRALEKAVKSFSSNNPGIKKSSCDSIEMILTNLNAMDRGTGEVNPDKKSKQTPVKIPNSVNTSKDLSLFVENTYNTILGSKGIDIAKNNKFAMDLGNNQNLALSLKASSRGR